jgi:hypothetical protein
MVLFQQQAGTRQTYPDDGGGCHQNMAEYKEIL